MLQAELDREVSRHTGETLGTIRRRGFSMVPPPSSIYEPESDESSAPQFVDWDDVDAQRRFAA